MDPQTWKELHAAIRDLGFPVFVACYLLLRLEPRIKEFTAALHDVAAVMRSYRDGRPVVGRRKFIDEGE